jgi:hypothetical protein
VPIDQRILRVGITVNGKLNIINAGIEVENHLAITAQGSKFASATQNETVIKICNLNKSMRDFLATEGTPFNRIRQKKRNKIWVDAGRVGEGTARMFTGDITLVTVAQPPDIWTTIRAITSQYLKGEIIATNESGLSTVAAIATKAAENMGLSLQNESTDKQVANYGFSGPATKQVDSIGELGDFDAFVDDDKLVVKDKGVPLRGRARTISRETGMVGLPEFTDFGIKVRYMFNVHSKIGQQIRVISKFNPAANGAYEIYKLDFDLANRDTPFYYVAETKRNEAIL